MNWSPDIEHHRPSGSCSFTRWPTDGVSVVRRERWGCLFEYWLNVHLSFQNLAAFYFCIFQIFQFICLMLLGTLHKCQSIKRQFHKCLTKWKFNKVVSYPHRSGDRIKVGISFKTYFWITFSKLNCNKLN